MEDRVQRVELANKRYKEKLDKIEQEVGCSY